MSQKKYLLLINPWIYDFTACDFWLRPLGLLYIAAILKRYSGFELSFLDCLDSSLVSPGYDFKRKLRTDGRSSFYKEEVAKPELFKHIPRKFSRYGLPLSQVESVFDLLPAPEAVLITCTMTYWYPGVQTAVDLVRKKFGGVPVVLGGIYATLCPEHARRHSGADYVVEGQGETQILQLIQQICGLGSAKSAGQETYFPYLDSLPFPFYEFYKDNSAVCLMTSRGCPFRCTYCASHLLCPRFEQRQPEKVLAEIISCKKALGTRHIAFYDDALLINKDRHLIRILEGLAPLNIDINFHTPNGLHPREIDRPLARLLKKTGFASLFLSLETADPNLLAETGAKVSAADLEKALNHLEETGFKRSEISVYLLVGLPRQDKHQVIESIQYVQKLGARARLAYFSPVPGTEDWSLLVSSGKLNPDSDPLLHNKLIFPYFWSQITPEDFLEIKRYLEAH